MGIFRYNIVCLFFLIFSQLAFSQGQARIDSLQNIITGQKDTIRAKSEIELSQQLLESKLERSFEYAQKALQTFLKYDHKKGILKAYNIYGNYYQRKGSLDTALMYYEKVLDISLEINDHKGLAIVYNNIAIININKGDYESALKNMLLALDYEKKVGDKNGISEGYNNVGVIQYYIGNIDGALEYFKKSAQIQEETGNLSMVKKNYINIGAVYQTEKKDFQNALRYYTDALKIAEDLKEESEIALILNNIGGLYSDFNQANTARSYYDRSLKIRQELGDNQGIAKTYFNYATMYERLNENVRAEDYYNRALDLARQIGSKPILKEAYGHLSAFIEKQGNYKKALKYHQQYVAIKDSILNETTAKNLADLETRYRTAEKEKALLKERSLKEQITLDAKRKAAEDALKISNRNMWIYGLTGGLLAILFLALFIIQRNRRKAQAEKDALLIQERDKAIKAVIEAQEEERKRIAKDLHDGIGQQLSGLKMAWQNLSTDMGRSNSENYHKLVEISAVLDESAEEVRSISHQMMPRALQELGLVPAIQDMLDKTLRYTDLQYEFYHHNVEQRFDENKEIAVYRVCQELVNNVIKHSEAKSIFVQLLKNNNHLILIVEDNGKGIKASKISEGLGMQNMRTRLHVINGEIHFDRQGEKGTVATIRIPV